MLGTDYEKFVLGPTGEPIAATVFGLGGKREAHTPLYAEDGELVGSIHRDNLMAEMCALPAPTYKQFAQNVVSSLVAAKKFIKDFNPEFSLSPSSQATFYREELQTPEAMDIGCDQDYLTENRTSQRRPPVTAEGLDGMRFAGGHLHVSYDTSVAPPWVAAMLADVLVGLPNSASLNPTRAVYYGLAGLHRPTRYPDGTKGMEYRVLDSFWVQDVPDMRAIKPMGLVQELLTPTYADATRQLVELHRRAIPPRSLIAFQNYDTVREDVNRIMAQFAGALLEEYHDSI